MVMVMVVVVVMVRVRVRAPTQHGDTDADDEQPGREREPRIQLLRQYPGPAQPAGRVGRGSARADGGAVAGPDLDRLPADPPWERPVVDGDAARAACRRAQRQLEPRRAQAALPG